MASVPRRTSLPGEATATRLSLKRLAPISGYVDGAWWPRSRDLAVEAPLVALAVATRVGPVRQIAFALEAWDPAPRSAEIDVVGGGHAVMLVGFASQDPHVVLVTGVSDRTLGLLVVPPEASPRAGHAALARASRPGNAESPATLLAATGSLSPRP
jgi:hypothetical protein